MAMTACPGPRPGAGGGDAAGADPDALRAEVDRILDAVPAADPAAEAGALEAAHELLHRALRED